MSERDEVISPFPVWARGGQAPLRVQTVLCRGYVRRRLRRVAGSRSSLRRSGRHVPWWPGFSCARARNPQANVNLDTREALPHISGTQRFDLEQAEARAAHFRIACRYPPFRTLLAYARSAEPSQNGASCGPHAPPRSHPRERPAGPSGSYATTRRVVSRMPAAAAGRSGPAGP
jgi:hypothetical protein